MISDQDRAVLAYFQTHGTPAESRRARIVLMRAEGAPTAEIAAAVALSKSRVRYWTRAWNEQGRAMFPDWSGMDDDAAQADTESAADQGEAAPVPGVDMPRLPLEMRDTVGMSPDDPMAEAGRKALYFHFERMLFNEPVSRLGDDIEGVHDMRVATRRMRSALRLFGPFFDEKAIEPFGRDLRTVAGALGAVRDLDVFKEKAEHFMADHPDADLTPLLDGWEQRYAKARRKFIATLDKGKYERFVARFHEFLITPGAGALPSDPGDITAYQVRHVAPRLIYEHYEQVRAYEAVTDDAPITTLHALRIDFKRLRYTLEFFEEVLGSQARQVINEIKTMQDHLGDLNDADVAETMLREFVDHHNQAYSGVPLTMRPDISGVLAYAAAKDEEKRRLLDTFPKAWANFNRDKVRRDLALAVSVL
jgi:CHAD domain-containing protein